MKDYGGMKMKKKKRERIDTMQGGFAMLAATICMQGRSLIQKRP